MQYSSAFSFLAVSFAVLSVSAQNPLDIVPKDWMEKRDKPSVLHLGDDGVLRRMEINLPTIARRDDHLHAARWEVRDAMPLAPQEIRRWIDSLGPSYSAHSRRHFEEVYASVDGRDVHPDAMMNPHSSIRLRSPGSILDVREDILRRRMSDGNLVERDLTRRATCHEDWDCGEMFRCFKMDMAKVGRCVPDANAAARKGKAGTPAKAPKGKGHH